MFYPAFESFKSGYFLIQYHYGEQNLQTFVNNGDVEKPLLLGKSTLDRVSWILASIKFE